MSESVFTASAAVGACAPLGPISPSAALWAGFAAVAVLAGIALWTGRRRGLGRRSAAGPLLLLAAHPALWLSGEERCGSRALLGASLMGLLAVGALISALLRPADRAGPPEPG